MFSKTEELNYLTDLLLSASQWQCSENEPLSPLHLEVKDRIRRLTEQETINVVGIPSDQIEGREQNIRRTEQMNKARRKYQENKVRVGKSWYPREMVEKQMLGPNKFKWVLKQTSEQQ